MHIRISMVQRGWGIAIYPACETSSLLAQLAGTKTLTLEALKIIKALGYTVSTDQAPIPERKPAPQAPLMLEAAPEVPVRAERPRFNLSTVLRRS